MRLVQLAALGGREGAGAAAELVATVVMRAKADRVGPEEMVPMERKAATAEMAEMAEMAAMVVPVVMAAKGGREVMVAPEASAASAVPVETVVLARRVVRAARAAKEVVEETARVAPAELAVMA